MPRALLCPGEWSNETRLPHPPLGDASATSGQVEWKGCQAAPGGWALAYTYCGNVLDVMFGRMALSNTPAEPEAREHAAKKERLEWRISVKKWRLKLWRGRPMLNASLALFISHTIWCLLGFHWRFCLFPEQQTTWNAAFVWKGWARRTCS